ncbi:MAG: hypothetical protein J3T61_01215 [Candidatus Brocadiales bacterium]|nr:hypothetical protein [Candidatus Bathyanammoxibius sp.]
MPYDNPKKKKGIGSREFFGSSIFDASTPVHKLVAQAPGQTVRGETIIAAPKKKVAPKKLSLAELAKQQRAKKKSTKTKSLTSGSDVTSTAQRQYEQAMVVWRKQRAVYIKTGIPFATPRPQEPKKDVK